jgi:tetratricopeptide (TPR) repeat protein
MKSVAVLLGTLLLCIGCGGPTKAGIEARANAHKRMDSVNADLAAQQAMQKFEVGQLDTALETIDGAIARYSENGEYHLLRGRILLEQHHLDASHRALTKATQFTPELAEPYYFLGILHQRWGEDAKALDAYKQALENDSTHPQYLLAIAESHVALHQHSEAIEMLTSANQEFQHHPSVASLLGHIYLSMGEPETATKWFADSRLLGDGNIETIMSLAHAQFQSGRYAQCLGSLTTLSISQEELSPMFLRMQGKCLAATGRKIEGRDICLKVTRKTPNDPNAWTDLGYIAWEMGDYRRLAVCGKKISQLDPQSAEGPLFEGIAALHNGNESLAHEKLASLQSDNSIHGVDSILEMYIKSTNTGSETALLLDMPLKTAEGLVEPHHQDMGKESLPLASVNSDFPDSP